MSEFKISRLRFSWVGEWADQTPYNKDEIAQFNGKAYVCLIPHTSNSFYDDLGSAEPKWDLMMTGQTWKGPWQQFTFYSLDNIVVFGGVVYKCNTEHLAGSVLEIDGEKWDVYAESKTWANEWNSSTTYGVGDIVQYGGSAYECIISHISADTDLEGLESDYYGLDSTLVKWKIAKEGVQYRGQYDISSEDSTQTRYKLNDLVKYGPSIYKCVRGHAPTIPEVVDLGVYTNTAITPFGGSIIYTVTVSTGTNEYGTGNKFYIAGEFGASPLLALTRGLTYRFDQSDPSNATHQLLFSTTPNGTWNGGTEYTTGVIKVGTAGTAGAYTQITIPDNAPALYYYCTNHSGMGGTAIAPLQKTYNATPVANNINEGSALTINVATTNVADATTLYWTATNSGDFSTSSGSFNINGNAGSFTVTPTADTTAEGTETFTVSIRTTSVSGTIVDTTEAIAINDTSETPPILPTYDATPVANNIDEGSALTINVATTEVADATTLYWTATNDGDFTTSSGSFTITSNTGSFTVTPAADTTTEGAETFTVSIRTTSESGTIVDTTEAITINDTSTTPVVTADYTINITNSGATAYTLSGSDRNGPVSGNNATLAFNSGDIIDFVVNAPGHPFYIKTAQTTGTGDQAPGVTNNGAILGTVQWNTLLPGTFYYQCQFHSVMNAAITVS